MANERVTRDIVINYTESNAEVVKDTIKTIDRMIQNRQLNRYWKDQSALITDVTNSYEKYNKTLNKMDATELVKSFNALKALSGIKELDISQLLPNFDKVEGKVKELIKSIDLNEAFGVDAFSSAFKVFDMLKAGGVDLQDFFKHFDLDIDTENLQKSLRLAEKEIQRIKNKLVEKDMKIDSLISGSGFSELQSQLERANDELSSLKSNATEVFKQFLRSNGFDDYFTSFKDNELFRPYIEEIEKGYITSTQAITQFKLANRDLLQDFNKNTENGFDTEQLNLFLNKLEEIFKQTQAISENINNIMTNGVMTKAMQNLSVDNSISQSQRDLFANVLKDEEALSSIAGVLKKIIDESVTLQGVNNKTFDEEQFNRLLILFEKIESSLSSMKAVFVDVGDGEEFSPLLKMINNVQSSVKELSTSVSGIKLDINMDLGSEVNERMNQKVSQTMNRQLEAYRNLFAAMKSTGKTNKEMLRFFEPDDASISEIIGAYKGMIKRAEEQFGKDIYKNKIGKDTYSAYIKEIKNATDQFNRATNKKNTENPLGDLFGKNELIEVVSQLGLIADKLSEISSTVSGLGDTFKNVFKEGFNVSASVEEIEKLTSRVKELEDELSKVKVSSTSPVETNISSPIKDTFQGGTSEASKMEEVATATTDAVQAKKDFANANERVQTSVDNSKSKLELESELMEEVAKSADKATKAKDKYSKRSKISEDTYTRKSDDYASIANQKLNNSGYTILGKSVSTELENGLVKVSAKIKNADGIWKTFSAKIDADGNMFEQRFRTVTNGIEKLENELRNFDRESTNSVNRVNKTFAYIDVPKESFDDIIAKFNIIEEKAKNIVKITRSDVQNNDGTYSTSYTARYKDGSNEILGESSDPQLLRRTNVLYDAQQAVKESNKAYKELIKTIQNYSEVQKRIAKNEAFDGDLALAQKLRDEITELQKQPILSSTQLEEANKRLVKLRVQVEKIREQTQQTTQSKVDKALVSQLSAWKSIQGIREKIAKTDEKDTTKLQKLNEEKKGYQKQYLEAEKVLKANEDLYDKESQLAKLELERLETNEKINKLKLNNVDVGSVLSKGDSDLKKFEARKNQSEEYRGVVEKLKQSIEELRVLEQSMVKSKLLPDGEAQKINEAVASIEKYTNAIKNMPAGEKGSDALSRDKWANRIQEYMDKNTRLTREFREELENLIRILRTGGDSVVLKDVIGQFEDAKFRIKEAKLEGKSFFDIFKNKAIYGYAAKLANYYLSFYDWIRYTRYAINALVELDSALLDLKKTTAMTENQLEDFYYASNDVAKQMGVTTAEIIEQASAWSRLGYSSEEAATKMAQLSSQFASISPGMETDQAQEGLVSIMKAWDIDPDEVESEIMDNINILGNSFAESNSDLVEGMKRSAAALSAVGTDYKDAFALFTGAQEILQNAEVTGRALRSISMRVRGYSESSEDGFEELDDELKTITGDLIDLTKTAEHSQGVSIFKDGSTTEFKSLVEYFGEISEIWDEMTQKQQNDFLQKAFGKTQANLCLYVQRCA